MEVSESEFNKDNNVIENSVDPETRNVESEPRKCPRRAVGRKALSQLSEWTRELCPLEDVVLNRTV